MRYSDLKRHLKPYLIRRSRTTTINHAFAAAVAPCDEYDDVRVCEAMRYLGQANLDELRCAYCGDLADTWDHIFATVHKKEFSGYGHRLGNLLPCCKPCNSSKGNKRWVGYLEARVRDLIVFVERRQLIDAYLKRYARLDTLVSEELPEYKELKMLQEQILNLFLQADQLAEKIRAVNSSANSSTSVQTA